LKFAYMGWLIIIHKQAVHSYVIMLHPSLKQMVGSNGQIRANLHCFECKKHNNQLICYAIEYYLL